jgi:hypothetical protein
MSKEQFRKKNMEESKCRKGKTSKIKNIENKMLNVQNVES